MILNVTLIFRTNIISFFFTFQECWLYRGRNAHDKTSQSRSQLYPSHVQHFIQSVSSTRPFVFIGKEIYRVVFSVSLVIRGDFNVQRERERERSDRILNPNPKVLTLSLTLNLALILAMTLFNRRRFISVIASGKNEEILGTRFTIQIDVKNEEQSAE